MPSRPTATSSRGAIARAHGWMTARKWEWKRFGSPVAVSERAVQDGKKKFTKMDKPMKAFEPAKPKET